MFLYGLPYSSGSSMKDVIADFTLIIPVGFHLERVIGREKNKKTKKPPRFLQLKNPSTLHSKISCHLGFLPLKEGTEVGGFPLLVRRAVTGNVKGKRADTSGKYWFWLKRLFHYLVEKKGGIMGHTVMMAYMWMWPQSFQRSDYGYQHFMTKETEGSWELQTAHWWEQVWTWGFYPV